MPRNLCHHRKLRRFTSTQPSSSIISQPIQHSLYIHSIHTHPYIPNTMFRTAIAKAAPSFRVAAAPLARPTLSLARPTLVAVRGYAASAGLSKDDISSRVLEVMKTFEKVDGGKVGFCYRDLDIADQSSPSTLRSIYINVVYLLLLTSLRLPPFHSAALAHCYFHK